MLTIVNQTPFGQLVSSTSKVIHSSPPGSSGPEPAVRAHRNGATSSVSASSCSPTYRECAIQSVLDWVCDVLDYLDYIYFVRIDQCILRDGVQELCHALSVSRSTSSRETADE